MPRGKYVRTEKYRNTMSKVMKGHPTSVETRQKISIANKGTKPSRKAVMASVKARKGIPLTEEHRKKIGRSGEESGSWKGDDASYWAKHLWANSFLTETGKCGDCGTDKNLQWSNKDHKYKRKPEDWQRLCSKCHRKYDDLTFGRRIPWNKKTVNGLA